MNEIIEVEGITFIKITPSEFMMGKIDNDLLAKDNETPHAVILTNTYFLSQTPITVGQYKRYVDECNIDTSYLIEKWDGEDWIIGPYFNDINTQNHYPVVGVSYNDAIGYINWLNTKHDNKYIFRLPTEAEFEFAARSNCTCVGQCKFAEQARQFNLDRKEEELPRKKSFSVDKMIVNDFGLKGMHCSIWQWCNDWYYYYPEEPLSINPEGPRDIPPYAPWKGEKWKPGKVIRGGSFSYPFYHSRCSDRHYSLVDDRNYNVGFRLALEVIH